MKKWLLVIAGVVGFLLVVLGVYVMVAWPEVEILMGTEELEGEMEAIPAAAVGGEIEPVTKGEADWLCWRGAAGDGISGVKGILKDWSGGLEQLWEVNFLCQGKSSASWSAPVVQGNRLVVCGRDDENDLIFCLDPADGRLIWQVSYRSRAGSTHGTGPRATPYIDEDRVYTFGRGGELGCWSLLEGKELWRRNVAEEGGEAPNWGHSSSPLVVGDKVIVQGGGAVRTVAYDKMSGEVVWKSGMGLAGYAAPAVMKPDERLILLVFHGKGLAGIDGENGDELWDVPWETSYNVNAGTPIVTGNKVFITSGYNTGGMLLKISREGVEGVWRNKVIASHHSDPYIIDGFLYGYSGQSNQNRGEFKCVELSSGKEQWSSKEMGWGTCVLVDGYLLSCDIRGNIYLMKPDPEKFIMVTEMGRALGAVRGPVWTIPVVANGRLFLRCKQRMVCYSVVSS